MAGPVAEITMQWRERLVFEAGAPGQPRVLVDGDSKVATSPVEMLLVAAATCTASDVVLILEKQRVTLRSLEATVKGTRREQQPRRYTALHSVFTIAGEGALGVRCEATAQFLLRPGERSGAGPYAGLGLAFVGGEGARGAGYLTALLGVESAPAARAGWYGELGLGGGVRVAVGRRFRHFPPGW